MEHNIPTDSGLAAIVNPDEMVTLWKGVTPIQVASSNVEEMRALGFTTRSPKEIPDLASQATTYAELIPKLIDGFLVTLEDGVIDTSELAALASLEKGMTVLAQSVGELLSIAHSTYPVKQGEPMTVQRVVEKSDGEKQPETTQIDPGQLEDFVKQGWRPLSTEEKK